MTTKLLSIGNVQVPVMFGDPRQLRSLPLDHPKARYPGFKTETKILPKGWKKTSSSLDLPCDILFEKDVPVTLKDGTVLYVDVFRPPPNNTQAEGFSDTNTSFKLEVEKVPAILTWSPYGKSGLSGCQLLSDFPFRLGVPAASLSDLQRWEGPDPAYWVQHGYAVVNADARGAGSNDGDISVMGSQEGRDGKEIVDWVGAREWCSGRVGMCGNSWLATSQWYIAAEKPKYLTCIAPWEGMSNLITEVLLLGGVPAEGTMSFLLGILALNAGTNTWENPVAMVVENLSKQSLGLEEQMKFKKYFEDKRAKIENIDIPAYAVASWGNPLHTYGTFRTFQLLKDAPKWLRVHDSFEWPDFYSSSSQTDLHQFFDHYLKGIPNNWPLTPRFRAQIIDTSNPYPLTGTLLSAPAFPLPRSQATPLKLFLASDQKMDTIYPPSSSTGFSNTNNNLFFHHTFTQDTILCGAVDMHLFVSLHGALEDADLHISLQKVLTSGNIGGQLMIPFQWTWQSLFVRLVAKFSAAAGALIYNGPYGCARVSKGLKAGDKNTSTPDVPGMPVHRVPGNEPSFVQEGEIYEVQPCITPMGMHFSKGEKLRIEIKGTDGRVFQGLDGALTLDKSALQMLRGEKNEGEVKLHFGGHNGSWLEIDTVLI